MLYEVTFTRDGDHMPVTVDAHAYRVSPDGVRIPHALLEWAFEYGRGIYADGFTVSTLFPVTLRNAGRQGSMRSELGEYVIDWAGWPVPVCAECGDPRGTDGRQGRCASCADGVEQFLSEPADR